MTTKVSIVKYDAATQRYVAELTVTEDEKVSTYRCEGQWKEGCEANIAESLYSQHRVVASASKASTDTKPIADKIAVEVDKIILAEVK